MEPTDEVPADPADEVTDGPVPDDERPVVPGGAGDPGPAAVPDEERPVGHDDPGPAGDEGAAP